jgi:hypothetical protein
MLLPKDINPKDSLFFHGGPVIQALKIHKELSFMDLFLELKTTRDIPMPLFALTLDWLYLADIVRFNKNEKIELCS